MKEKNIAILLKDIHYQFIDPLLLKRALTHKSAHFKNNERLEYLGDSVLNFIIADVLYQQFLDATEGELTRARASLVNKSTLAQVAQSLNLGDYLTLGIGELRSGGFRRDSILADTLEALLGAIYLDGGLSAAQAFVRHLWAQRIEQISPYRQEKDPKTQLQEWLQANHKSLPKYEVILTEGEPHAQVFTVSCEVEGYPRVEGQGMSRRFAEQQAAHKMLEIIYAA